MAPTSISSSASSVISSAEGYGKAIFLWHTYCTPCKLSTIPRASRAQSITCNRSIVTHHPIISEG